MIVQISAEKIIHFGHALGTKILVQNSKKCDFLNLLSFFWGVTHIKRHSHPQIFCGIVVHDRADVRRKNYSFWSRFRHKIFGLKLQKCDFLNFLAVLGV